MQVRGRPIGPSHPPYVIAEVSCNHAGSENVAMALIQVAKDAGAEAVKFQFYTPEGMVGKGWVEDFDTGHIQSGDKPIQEGPWAGQTMYELYDKAQMPWEWGPDLKAFCHSLDLAFIASAYELDGLNWLMQNCVPDALKVASFEATDTPFVAAMVRAGLPVILSLGMTTKLEQVKATNTLAGAPHVLLHCVSAYPTIPQHANLQQIPVLAAMTGSLVGFSDHTRGAAVACAAIAQGACVLEKHIQLHPRLVTADSGFSCTPSDFTDYCMAVEDAWLACQSPTHDAEAESRQFRRAPGGKRGSYAG